MKWEKLELSSRKSKCDWSEVQPFSGRIKRMISEIQQKLGALCAFVVKKPATHPGTETETGTGTGGARYSVY
jgi:hypothetical protein